MLSNSQKNNFHTLKKVLTIVVFAIVAPFYVSASEAAQSSIPETTPESKGLSAYKDSLAFKWSASVNLNSHYIWRGLYIGGINIQPEATIGFEGFRAGLWWNVGAEDWGMQSFLPELDVWLSYSKYGVTLQFIQMYYFDRYKDGTPSLFFDYKNHGPGEGGCTTEIRLRYRVSDKIPLTMLWATRFVGRDGYYIQTEEQSQVLKRAYSTYIEFSYDIALPWSLTLSPTLGITPWRSLYTGFEGKFAVVNTDLQLRRAWEISRHTDITAAAEIMINPYNMAHKQSHSFNWNIAIGLQFK